VSGFGERVPEDPCLRTSRLVLRPLAYADVDAVYAAVESSRASLAEWLPWARAISGPDELRLFVDRSMRQNRQGQALRGVFEPGGDFVGHVALEDPQPERSAIELGYWIRADRTGRGYATEAARALCAWAFRKLDLHRIFAYSDVANAASRRVLEKCGFTLEGVVRHRAKHADGWRDHALYGLIQGEGEPGQRP
jgi:RimJ/RimL family protein N-acetyltransferase